MLRPVFSTPRFGPRYRKSEVDAFVDRLMATVNNRSAEQPVTKRDLQNADFAMALWGPGYSVDEVDRFVEEAERWLVGSVAPATTEAARTDAARTDAGRYPPPQFSVVRMQEGYDIGEVDEFVRRVLATLEGQPVYRVVTPDEVRGITFTPTRVRRGYEVVEVDDFLEQAEAWLTDRGGR